MTPTELNILRAQMAATIYAGDPNRYQNQADQITVAIDAASKLIASCCIFPDAPAPAEPASVQREPDGYAYEYADGIRFTAGGSYNGSKPKRAVPYWFAPPPPAEPAKPEPDYEILLRDLVQAIKQESVNTYHWNLHNSAVLDAAVAAVRR